MREDGRKGNSRRIARGNNDSDGGNNPFRLYTLMEHHRRGQRGTAHVEITRSLCSYSIAARSAFHSRRYAFLTSTAIYVPRVNRSLDSPYVFAQVGLELPPTLLA